MPEPTGVTQDLQVSEVTAPGNWADHNESTNTTDMRDAIAGETADDNTYIQSEESPESSVVVYKFAAGAFPDDQTQDHNFKIRYRRTDGEDQIDLTFELREGYVDEATQGTLIWSDSVSNVGTTVVELDATLTEVEAGNITDYSDLYGRVVANVPV